jgi:dTDP-4-amino-4,6-dideoxygalactose transaminase
LTTPAIIRFQAPSLPSLDEVQPFFAQSEKLRWFANRGPCVIQLEQECAHYLDLDNPGVLVSSATAGLMTALRACFGFPRDERKLVAVPSFTFVASVNAIMWAGFQPVFIDIDPDDWLPSEDSLRRLGPLRGSLAGVLQCSTFGVAPSPSRRASLPSVIAELGVPTVVDSAAGFGAVDEQGRRLGDQGDAEVFSFHATKPFAIGEGGLVTSRSGEVLEGVTRLSNFGFDHAHRVPGDVGINAKLPELSAAVGLAVLRKYEEALKRRREAAAWIREALADSDVAFQSGSEGSAFQFVPVAMPDYSSRQRLLAMTADAGVEVRTYFDPPMHKLETFNRFATADSLENTVSLSQRIVSLPMANDISMSSLERIRDLVLGAIRS